VVLSILLLSFVVLSGSVASAQTDTSKSNPPLIQIPADSLLNYVPGGVRPGRGGDSAYLVWLYAKIRPIVRLREALLRDTAAWYAFLDSLENTPEAIMQRNLALNPKDWMPSEADRAKRELEIRNSQDWNYIHPNGITYIPLASVPLSDIGRVLGLTEDVSPRINYTVASPENVSVKIYNLSAELVSTLVDALKKPGTYRMEWDMRDDQGRRAPSGDYIAEVIIGTRVAFRKRIVVP